MKASCLMMLKKIALPKCAACFHASEDMQAAMGMHLCCRAWAKSANK